MRFKLSLILFFLSLFVLNHAVAENRIMLLKKEITNNKVILSPILNFSTSEQIKEAIDNGIRINLVAKIKVYQPNSWWFDDIIMQKKIDLEVSYFTLGNHYVVKNKATGEQLGFNDYASIWNQFEKLIHFEFKLSEVKDKWLMLRIRLDKGALPTAMQLPVLFSRNWSINTPWHQQSFDADE